MIVYIEAFGYRTLAGNERNWPYAAYELDQRHETFADVVEILPKNRDLSVPDLITSTVKDPLVALDRAVQTKDGQQFAAAYAQLTAACNVCHQRYDRTAIMIQRPPAAAPLSRSGLRPPTK